MCFNFRMHNTKCMCYENYTRLKFRVFDLCENKVIANISGYTVLAETFGKKNLTGDF